MSRPARIKKHKIGLMADLNGSEVPYSGTGKDSDVHQEAKESVPHTYAQ